MTKSVELPSKTFKSRSEATNFFTAMLNRYSDGEDLSTEDGKILFELLKHHPESIIKIGASGVRRFFRNKSDMPTSCFHIERNDGSTTDFSFGTCIKGKAPTKYQEFYQACRCMVSADLIEEKKQLFKEAGGTLKCNKTGEKVTLTESEYRHTEPRFEQIVEMFIREEEIDIKTVGLSETSDMQYITSFTD